MTVALHAFDDAHGVKRDLAGDLLRSIGTLHLRATGRSMLPTVLPGDTLVIERIDSEVFEGDIVLFSRNRRFVAHRVVTKCFQAGGRQVVTRGDALLTSDLPLSEDELLGKVSCIVRNGRCIEPRRNLRFSERAVA